MKHVKSLLVFFEQTIIELKKIQWPTKRELMISFCFTLFIIIIASILLWGIDSTIGVVIKKIITITE